MTFEKVEVVGCKSVVSSGGFIYLFSSFAYFDINFIDSYFSSNSARGGGVAKIDFAN